ncbi:MAG: BON domain-containing protein [Deltaproteobacteria bacterium]|nr:MAG: BON domain-containing protein [Deltaproteobacteria bacterium]
MDFLRNHQIYLPAGRWKGGLKMPVITISRQLGSLGTEIAQGAAEKLNYEYVDKKRIEQALSAYGVLAPEVEKFDEKKPSFWDSFLLQKKRFLHSLEAVVYDFARNGKVVIVGRGGQVLLQYLPGVLHVRIIAPFEVRLKRLLAAEGGNEKKASRILSRSDRDSAGFLRSFFEVDWEDRTLYDLMINTEKLSAETAVKMIVASVSSPEIQEGEKKSDAKLADLALTQKVEVALMKILGIGFGNVTVLVKGGVVSLSGQVASERLKEDVLRAIKQIEGVTGVNCQFYIYAQYYGP